jgi:hypothetical protein
VTDEQAPGATGDHEVGSLAEEAAKLLGALSGWAKEQGGEAGAAAAGFAAHAADAARGVDEHLATGAPECTWCPVCRTVHLVRQTSPEVRAHLAIAASSLVQAAAGVLATVTPDSADPGNGESGSPRGPQVERIDLDDEWPEEES